MKIFKVLTIALAVLMGSYAILVFYVGNIQAFAGWLCAFIGQVTLMAITWVRHEH